MSGLGIGSPVGAQGEDVLSDYREVGAELRAVAERTSVPHGLGPHWAFCLRLHSAHERHCTEDRSDGSSRIGFLK